MSTNHAVEEAVDILQELGLKEYEAKCFASLTRLPRGTAKQLSEITDVPRTRVYDAIRVLEAQGLVEVQHTSPQQFRAVPLTEAVSTLRERYESRVQRLADALQDVEPVDGDGDESIQEVWSLRGPEAIEARVETVLAEASNEVVLVIGQASLLTDDLVSALNGLPADVDLFVGAVDESLETVIGDEIPHARTFVSGLDWLHAPESENETEPTAIGRLLLVDRSTILVSTILPDSGEEQAVFGGGYGNGLVVIVRRLMAQGLQGGEAASD